MINRLKEKSWQEIIYMYAYTRFNAYRRRKEISGIGLQARRSLAGNLYNDFHLLLFGGSWDRDRGLSLSLDRLLRSSSSCASCSPFAFHLRHGYREGVSRGIAEQKQKPSRRRRVRRPPPSRSTELATSFSLALPLSRGWHRPPLCTLRLGGPCSRRQSSPEDSANRSRRPDASPTNPSDSLTLATLPLLSNMRYKFAIRLVRGIRMGE